MNIDPELVLTLRDQQCWSQEDLALASGVSTRTIQRVENGAQASRETLQALAAAFDVEPHALLRKERAMQKATRNNDGATLALWIHLATYIGVIALLSSINIASQRSDFWVTWIAIGWGVGVFSHAAVVIIGNAARRA